MAENKWVTGVGTLVIGVIGPFRTGRPPCSIPVILLEVNGVLGVCSWGPPVIPNQKQGVRLEA